MLILKLRTGVRVVGYLGVAAALRRAGVSSATMRTEGMSQQVAIRQNKTVEWTDNYGIWSIGLQALADSGHDVEIQL